jgi:hypothetical protein
MKSVLIITLALIIEAGCGGRIAQQANTGSLRQPTATPLTIAAPEIARSDSAEDLKKSNRPPHAFSNIDFKNLSYPISWKNERISLQNGKREYYEHKNLGNSWFELEAVHYVDITGDEREEAIVILDAVLCGVSCDGGSHLFYFYSVEKGKLKLLWRFETGSLGDGCGLRSFDLSQRGFELEVFNVCFFHGATLEPRDDLEKVTGKFHAELVTRFTFEFRGKKPVLKKRELLPTSQGDLRSYRAQIVINK